jgi:hypothetical protein
MFDPFDPGFFGGLDDDTREFFAKLLGQGCAKCRLERSGLREFPPGSKQLCVWDVRDEDRNRTEIKNPPWIRRRANESTQSRSKERADANLITPTGCPHADPV